MSRWWLPAVWMTLSVVAKAALSTPQFLDPSAPIPGHLWIWGALNVACLGMLYSLAPRRTYLTLVFLTVCVFSLLFWSDVLYWRAFSDISSLYLLDQLGNVNRVRDTMATLIRPIDLGLFADLPAIWWMRRITPAPPRVRRGVALAVTLAAVLLNVVFTHPFRTATQQRYLLMTRFKNVGPVYLVGLVNYHFFDLYDVLEDQWERRMAAPPPLDPLLERVRASRRSIAEDTPMRGVARGKNVLILQVESLQMFALDLVVEGQEVTPFLSRLRKQAVYSDLFFDETHTGSSSDCDFALLNSMYPAPTRPACFEYATDSFYALPRILKEHGYSNYYAHPYDPTFCNYLHLTVQYGYTQPLFFKDLPPPRPGEVIGWGFSDEALLQRVWPHLLKLEPPFFAHVVSTMGHHPFAELEPSQHLLKLKPSLQKSILGNYLQICRFRDAQLERFFTHWQGSELSKDTVLVFLGDHASILSATDVFRVRPSDVPELDATMRLRVPFFMLIPGVGGQPVEGPTGLVDVAPTLLHLLGVESARPVFLGRNMFSREVPPLAVLRKVPAAVDARHVCALEGQGCLLYRERRADPGGCEELRQRGTEALKASDQIMRFDLVPRLRERE